jgi:hypothetical protein
MILLELLAALEIARTLGMTSILPVVRLMTSILPMVRMTDRLGVLLAALGSLAVVGLAVVVTVTSILPISVDTDMTSILP